eukprot:CAMPEP_0206501234 /NCGR_PEP_ID=MMETSP0324_2-20121206/53177_1 /ASSEMBLY_ACC=CAM_ASM_000836 /TAXON_ID=2866 /ORGANISM="Crypthecodinium cohnii, Strain Seligo" /LENGTH=760 /DNA_ID=CAMNT_0053988991 /DNA_START=113 /DNA_END=2390 /DNA_ORIENTATION=+
MSSLFGKRKTEASRSSSRARPASSPKARREAFATSEQAPVAARSSITSNASESLADVRVTMRDLSDQCARLAESNKDLIESMIDQERRIMERVDTLDSELNEALKRTTERHTDELLLLRKENEDYDARIKENRAGIDACTNSVEALRQELAQQSAALTEHREASKSEQQTLLENIAKVKEEAAAYCAGLEKSMAESSKAQEAKLDHGLEKVSAALGARCELLQTSIDDAGRDATAARIVTERRVDEGMALLKGEIAEAKAWLANELTATVAKLQESEKSQVEHLEQELRSQMDMVKRTVDLSENIFTRSIVWQARGFKQRLRDLIHEEDQVIQSPPFFLSGLPEMSLEIQMATKDDAPENSILGPSLPLPGSFSLAIWAAPGLQATFRITVGDGSSSVCRRYEHNFEAASSRRDAQGRAMFVVQNFCRLNQVWVRTEDRVRVSLELLDFSVQATPSSSLSTTATLGDLDGTAPLEAKTTQPPQAQAANLLGGAEVAEADASATAIVLPPLTAASTAEGSLPLADDPTLTDGSTKEPAPSDDLLYFRSATSQELVQERLMGELHAVRNRSVRRVEWKLEGCQRLLDCRPGEAIDSPPFAAAGLEKIQFHFYPRDTTSAGTSSQPCGVFVSGPARTNLKAMLWVGSFSRSFEHRFQKRGDTGGRGRFCTLEHQIDCSDSVVIAMDIVEVETDLTGDAPMSLCLRDARGSPNGNPGGGGMARTATTSNGHNVTSPLSGSKGALRMRREDATKTEEFVKCVSLP